MKGFRKLSLLLLISACARAQTTEVDLSTRLVNAPLYLRGQWSGDKLHFRSDGRLRGHSDVGPFTLAGVDVDTATMEANELHLRGRRVGVQFEKDAPKRVPLQMPAEVAHQTRDEAFELVIDRPLSGDYTQVLDSIFATSLADFVPQLAPEWKGYGEAHFVEGAEPASAGPTITPEGIRKIGGAVLPPRVRKQPEPHFTQAARFLRVSGNVLVYLQVSPEGLPDHIRILRPCGLGLDEAAVTAVKGYRFTPAMENGEPKRVEMNVAVNFQIF